MPTPTILKAKKRLYAAFSEIFVPIICFPGLLIASVLISKMSLIMFPAAARKTIDNTSRRKPKFDKVMSSPKGSKRKYFTRYCVPMIIKRFGVRMSFKNGIICILIRNKFQPNDGRDKCKKKENPPEGCRFFKKENPDENGSHSANSRPDGIGCANG